MKKILLVTAIASFVTAVSAADLKTDDNKISYTIGQQIGQSLESVGGAVKINEDVLFEAIKDKLAGKPSQMTEEQMNDVMKIFSEKRIAEQKKKMEEEKTKNKAEGDKFLADNKKDKGVKVTASGLEYKVITEGKGKKPTLNDTVKVNYEGTFADGKVFDSSYKRNEPVEFPLNGVIKGWQEGLQLMTVGSTYEFVVPAELAYGEHGPAQIGPNRVLKFKVELLQIVDKKAEEAAAKAKADAAEKASKDAKPADKTKPAK